jgi:ferric-dicitrate binding protein FerR (iron transport regulator)
MVSKTLTLLLLLPLLLSFIFPSSFAAGKVLVKKGDVKIDGQGVTPKTVFNNGQIITVGKSSLAIIRFENGNTLKINEKTSLKLESDSNKKTSESIFVLLKGSSFFNKNKNHKGSMTVKAKGVSMGVRGTIFFVSYGVEKPEDIYMCVNKGVVAVKGSKDAKEVLVKEGQGVVIINGKETSSPKFLPWTKNLNWKLSPGEKDLINEANIEESYNDMLEKDYD